MLGLNFRPTLKTGSNQNWNQLTIRLKLNLLLCLSELEFKFILLLASDSDCPEFYGIHGSEEAGELVQTLLEGEDRSRTASEMADLLYHSMVLLTAKDVKIEEVLEVLRRRFARSGIEEKNSRK